MAFNPSSTIYLCNVDIDNTYSNQIYFEDIYTQAEYFIKRKVYTCSDYLTVRKTKTDGSIISSVKVNKNIDALYDCNYMMYQNANHGTKWFYAFIVDFIYINEGTTEIIFETDVYQTWLKEAVLLDSFVEREHSATDEIGDNLVAESFVVNDFNYQPIAEEKTDFGQWGYLIACTEAVYYGSVQSPKPNKHSGIYQGLYFYFFKSFLDINDFIERLDDKGKESILSITAIPEFSVSHAKLEWTKETYVEGEGVKFVDYDDIGIVRGTDYPNEKSIVINAKNVTSMDGYKNIKNNKLWTYPFFSLEITNNSGDIREYNVEDFVNRANIRFCLYGDISVAPSLMIVPQNYKGISEESDVDFLYGIASDFGLSIGGFPQCAFINDYYKLWSAKNIGSQHINVLSGLSSAAFGTALALTGHPIAGGGAIVGGVTSIMSTINKSYMANVEADKATVGQPKNNLLTAMGRNKFNMRFKTLKYNQAKTLDNYFTMYGYQTNALKIPNISSRPYFNYVKTIDVNIAGRLPDKDMKILKSMYNNGVTFWKPTATVGDYSVDNRPVKG